MSTPQRTGPNGSNNTVVGTTLDMLGTMDPTKYIAFFDDFLGYDLADWLITTTEAAGAATELTINGHGGLLQITNGTADNDLDFLQWKGGTSSTPNETFLFTAGKKAWFKARLKVSDATESEFVVGLQITDTTVLAVTDGVFFQKDDGDALLDFHVEKNSTQTDATGIHTVVADTFLVVGFYYDGVSAIKYYVDDVHKGTTVTTNLPDDEELTVSFGIQNGEAAAKVLTIDYIFAAMER